MGKFLLVALVLAGTLGSGCVSRQIGRLRGEQSKREIYLNLMTESQAATFLEMERQWRDDEQLLLYCQECGVYQAWRATSPERQQMIRRRQIEVGMSAAQVQMAWGRPDKVEETTTAAAKAAGHVTELWSYDAESGTFLRQASMLDGTLEWYKDFRDKSLWKKMTFWKK